MVIALATLAVACGEDEEDPMVSPECQEATEHSDLDWLQTFVFTPGCAQGRTCHNFNTPIVGISLDIGDTEAALIDQPSVRVPSETLVIPGDPENSFLMVILGSRDGENPAGLMPPEDALCVEKRDAIERWIAALPN